MHPACEAFGSEWSHIIWRSESRKKAIDEDWNGVWLCAEHHRTGMEAVHRSKKWREYYYKYLPEDWQTRLDNCKELR
jgi:hypothetical protein